MIIMMLVLLLMLDTITTTTKVIITNNNFNNNVIIIKIIITIKIKSGCALIKIKSSYVYSSPHFLFCEKCSLTLCL